MQLYPFRTDLLTPRLPLEWIAANTHASLESVKNWVKRGQIEPAGRSSGTGKPHRYSVAQAVQLDLIGYLGRNGLAVTSTMRLSAAISDLLIERQSNGFLFDWSEQFALEMVSLTEEPPEPPDVSYWRHWGDLFWSFSDLEARTRTEYQYVAQDVLGRDLVERPVDGLPTPLPDPDNKLTDKEFEALAAAGVGAAAPLLVFPVGFLVNSVVMRAEKGET